MLSHNSAVEVVRFVWRLITIVWLIGRFTAKRTAVRPDWKSSIAYFGLLILSFLLLFDAMQLPDVRLMQDRPDTLGVALLIAGCLIAIWSRITLARNWSGAVVLKEEHELIERGPYRFVRHPMYTGLLLMVLGTALVRSTAQALAATIIFLMIHLWKMRAEEALLSRHFSEAYPRYKARTKALIPFVF